MPIRGGKAYRQHTSFKDVIRHRDDYRCQLCGCGVGDSCDRHWTQVTQIDVAHIVPFKDGGPSTPDNMRVVCHPCNKREGKGTQHLSLIREPASRGRVAITFGVPREGVNQPIPTHLKEPDLA